MTSQYDVKCQQKTRGGFPLIDFTKNRKPMCKGVHSHIYIHFLSIPNRSETFQRLALKKTHLFLPLEVGSFSRSLPTEN